MVDKYKQFEAKIKWYSKGELSDDSKEEPEVPTFYDGQKLKLINLKNCYWDEDGGFFRDSIRKDDLVVVVGTPSLYGIITKEIEGFDCVYCRFTGWYKISCVEPLKDME